MPPTPDVPAGRIPGAFGVKGELKCDPSAAGRALFVRGAAFSCRRNDEPPETVRIAAVRAHKGRLLIRLEGVDDCDAAETYAGASLFAERSRVQLAPGEYLDEDLVGCRAVGVDGTAYGEVRAVEHYPGSDMLLVNATLVPMVAAIVRSIDLDAREITIDPPEGLFE